MISPETVTHTTALSPQIPQSFLDKVACDDRFRSELEADPQRVLSSFGIHVDPSRIPERVTLPEKEALQAISPTGPADPTGDDIRTNKDAMWMGFLG